MLEGAVMEYAKWFIGVISVSFVGVVVVFMFNLNEVNSMQQEVNYQIERHGGLTEDALRSLNEHAKENYGGGLAATPDDNAPLLFPEEGVPSSGFFIGEVKEDDGTYYYYSRSNDEPALYGTQINYALTRQIGNINGYAFFKPGVFGESASRVRGVVEN